MNATDVTLNQLEVVSSMVEVVLTLMILVIPLTIIGAIFRSTSYDDEDEKPISKMREAIERTMISDRIIKAELNKRKRGPKYIEEEPKKEKDDKDDTIKWS